MSEWRCRRGGPERVMCRETPEKLDEKAANTALAKAAMVHTRRMCIFRDSKCWSETLGERGWNRGLLYLLLSVESFLRSLVDCGDEEAAAAYPFFFFSPSHCSLRSPPLHSFPFFSSFSSYSCHLRLRPSLILSLLHGEQAFVLGSFCFSLSTLQHVRGL